MGARLGSIRARPTSIRALSVRRASPRAPRTSLREEEFEDLLEIDVGTAISANVDHTDEHGPHPPIYYICLSSSLFEPLDEGSNRERNPGRISTPDSGASSTHDAGGLQGSGQRYASREIR